MANQLQKITVDKITTQYASDTGLALPQAFLYLVIEKFLQSIEPNPIEIEESIIDGSDDGGIDAVYINEDSTRPEIYFFQSKFHLSDNSFEKTFPGNDVDKVRSAVEEFVLKGKINDKYQNARLVDKLHSVNNLLSQHPRFTLVFCSNGAQPSTAAKAKLNEFIEEANQSGEYVKVEYIDLDRITKELVAPEVSKEINFDMQTIGRYLSESNGDVNLFAGMIEGSEVARLVEQYKDNLFEKNVRGFLKKNNPINKQIINSASSDQSSYFLYLNNGITITCKDFTHAPTQESPNLKITAGQIVNGQQTARSIYQANLENKLKSDVKVIVKVLKTSNVKILPKIIEATNSQTKVTSRDLHSNDETQRLIEQVLATQGYFYEARKGKYQGKERKRRVDAEVAAQAYYSIFFESPARAKDKKKDLFGSLYEEIFNEDLDPKSILLSHLMIEKVRSLNKLPEYSDKYNFLRDASLHTITLIYRISEESDHLIENEISTNFIKTYEKVLKAIEKIVKERSAVEKEKYEHRRTFKDPETYGLVLAKLL